MKRLEWAIPVGVMFLVGAVVTVAVMFATPKGGRQVAWELYWNDVPRPVGGYYVILIPGYGYGTSPSISESARRADLVAIAEVERQLPAFWWNTPGRKRPQNPGQGFRLLGSKYRIYTPYQLRITQLLKGEAPSDGKIQIHRFGGQVGKDVVAYSDDGSFLTPRAGMLVMVFLRDCGERRAERYGSPGFQYKIIGRIILGRDGRLYNDSLSVKEAIEIVGREKYLKPRAEPVGCS